ncbi:MAG: hypothetical protein Q9227_008670 [Pyrenula ochraceoflavens]
MFAAFTALSLSLLPFLPSTLAVPNVTATALDPGCASYPGFDASTGTAGPWTVSLVDSGNATVEGFSNTVEYSRGSTGIRFGYITFPTRNDIAKTPLQCSSNTLQGHVPTGVSGYSFEPLVISPYPYDATLIYGVSGNEVIPYTLSGIPGVFLGGEGGVVTWGLRYEPAGSGGDNLDFFYIRLLGPDSADPSTGEALYPGEFTAFIKINA